MGRITKDVLTPKWLVIKEMYEKGTNNSKEYGENFPIDGELDKLCVEFVDLIGEITLEKGFDCIIEGVHMDIWKQRIWSLIDNSALLEPIAWKLDEEYYGLDLNYEEEFDVNETYLF